MENIKKCPYCAEEIQQEALVCKHCKTDFVAQKKADEKKEMEAVKKRVSLILAVVIILFFIISVAQCSSKFSSSSSANGRKNYNSTAMSCAESKVKDILKSPSTAQFPWGDKKVTLDGNVYKVTGSVDAQNSFGATLRNSYTCYLTISSKTDCRGSCTLE